MYITSILQVSYKSSHTKAPPTWNDH